MKNGLNPGHFWFTNLPQFMKNVYDELVVFYSFQDMHWDDQK